MELIVLVAQLCIQRVQFLIDRLQLFLRSLQLFVRALQLFIRGEYLLIGRLEFFFERVFRFDSGTQGIARTGKFLPQPSGFLIALIAIF